MDFTDEILRQISEMRGELHAHLSTEKVILAKAELVASAHGDADLIATRIAFINLLMEREQDRKALRKAIIEKTVIGAIWALAIYLGLAVIHELRELVRGWILLK